MIREELTGKAHRHLLGEEGEGGGGGKRFFVRILMLSIMVKSKFGSDFRFCSKTRIKLLGAKLRNWIHSRTAYSISKMLGSF